MIFLYKNTLNATNLCKSKSEEHNTNHILSCEVLMTYDKNEFKNSVKRKKIYLHFLWKSKILLRLLILVLVDLINWVVRFLSNTCEYVKRSGRA